MSSVNNVEFCNFIRLSRPGLSNGNDICDTTEIELTRFRFKRSTAAIEFPHTRTNDALCSTLYSRIYLMFSCHYVTYALARVHRKSSKKHLENMGNNHSRYVASVPPDDIQAWQRFFMASYANPSVFRTRKPMRILIRNETLLFLSDLHLAAILLLLAGHSPIYGI